MLLANPWLGRLRPMLANDRYRFWSLRGFPYVLVYDAERSLIVIVRVIHQSCDLPAALDEGF